MATARFLGDLRIIKGMEMAIPKTGNRRTARKARRFLLRASLKLCLSSIEVTLPSENRIPQFNASLRLAILDMSLGL